ncbi:MAG: hypothetical protein M3619_02500 [Myxococcota bacterium]|nr:hypothetical protein [Myxococcota bacterium]
MERFARGYPRNLDDDDVVYGPLGDALTQVFGTDAHVAAYSVPTIPRRLAGKIEAIVTAGGVPVRMALAIFDVDAPEHKWTPEWWATQVPRVDRLLATHPGGYLYTTRGGYRVLWRLATPIELTSSTDGDQWSAQYLAWVDYLAREFEIEADRKCADWTRLYRLPRVLRDNKPTVPKVVGNPARIGTWNPPVIVPPVAARAPSAPRPPRTFDAPPLDDREAAARVLAGVWPSSGRHGASLTLCGALAHAGWTDEDIAAFVTQVCELAEPGNGDYDKRLSQAAISTSKVKAGEPVSGWPKLKELIEPDMVDRVTALLGLDKPKMTGLADRLRASMRLDTAPTTVDIFIGADLAAMTDAAEGALASLGGIYVRGRQLVRIIRDRGAPGHWLARSDGTPVIEEMPRARLKELLGVAARWLRIGKDNEAKPASVPLDVVEALLARGEWSFPQLEAVTDTPVLRADGSLLDVPGYDPATRLIYDPCGVEFPTVPADPGHDDAKQALAALLEPFAEFPFVAASDRGATAAMILSVIGRAAIDGCVPMFGVCAPTPGSGKGLLVDVVGIIATGRETPKMANTANDEETRKRLLAIAMMSPSMVTIDNVEGEIGSPSLAMALTSGVVSDRVLGASRMATVSLRPVWSYTGNNIMLRGDLGRRVAPIDLDPKVENPEDRTFERGDLKSYVYAHRPRLVVAALTVLRAYVLAGMPAHGKSPKGSFEAWDRLVRAAIIWAGEVDPLGGVERIRESGDGDKEPLGVLLTAWRDLFGGDPVTAAQILTEADQPMRVQGDAIKVARRKQLREALAAYEERSQPLDATRLGCRLRQLRGRIVGGLKIDRVAARRKDGVRWRIVG